MLAPNRGYQLYGHYCSEQFTSGERLLRALCDGWTIRDAHYYEYSLSRGRFVIVYHLTLQRAMEIAPMRVVANPFETRLLEGAPENAPTIIS
jgi:hypothetical protein